MTRRLLLPLMPLYAMAAAAKNAGYDRSWLEPEKLRWPVISVGNISTGGSGKTPFVLCLAELLLRQGVGVDVLSRGHGRTSNTIERVDSTGSAERYGDEPLLMAQSAKVPVYVGGSRYEAGLLAEKAEPSPRIHLLDDGFQHRKLARDLDIVLVHRRDLMEGLLPSGNLREPLSALRRASVLILREEDRDLEKHLKTRNIDVPIWWIKRTVNVPQSIGGAVVFCGIARPGEFFRSAQSSIEIAIEKAFPDHHPYTDADVERLARMAHSAVARAFLTTEKDFVRLSESQRQRLAAIAPLHVAKLEARLVDEDAAMRRLQPILKAVSSRPV